jgi:hypothetical protein
LINASNLLEIVKVIARAGDVFTIQRGQDGSSSFAYLAGDRIELRPVAALFNDKLSLGGGTLTGPLAVPAGAVTTQVPQVQEVVKRSGDTMTGPLTVPTVNVTTLYGSGGIVDFPTGNRLVSPDAGSFVAPGMVLQTVYARIDTQATYTYTTSAGPGFSVMDLTALTISITPKLATSKILLQAMISGSHSDQDFLFILDRNGTPIGRNASGTTRQFGLAAGSGQSGSTTTDGYQWNFFYMDAPGATSALTYKVQYQSSENAVQTRTFYLNRTAANTNADFNEVGISQIIAQEIAQ